ncbi:MAG: ABC transporter ATP-binding protein [Candidatus Omnitrophica bacterium]|nr:ABC transporter ATP-binding protein [Candidatus Omnitrophota bacterium]
MREFIRPYWPLVVWSSLLMLILTALLLPIPFLTKALIDRAVPEKDVKMVVIIFLLFVIVHLARNLISFGLQYVINFLGQRVVFHLRRKLHEKLQELQLAFYDTRLPGKIMARVVNDVNVVQNMVTGGFITMFTDVVMLILVVGIMVSIRRELAVISLGTLPFYALNYNFFVNKIRIINKKIRDKVAEIYGLLEERVSAIRIVKSFARENYEINQFSKKVSEHRELNIDNAVLNTILGAIAGVISGVGTGFVLWYGGRLIINGALTVGSLIAFYSFIGYLYGPIVRLTQINTTVQWVMVSVDRIFEIMDEPVTIKDSDNAVELREIIGQVSFRRISFKYKFGDRVILKNINLEVMPGTIVGIVGPSGSGKSTLLSLIPRFYEITEGAIFIDEYDLRDVRIVSLRQKIGFVPQESVLFSGSIKSNIKYGREDARDEEVIEAARAAEIHDFISTLPDKYDTEIGERGVTVSGGQRQRLAIARALLTNPQVLVLDDCTSSLDAETESRLQETLDKLMRGRTCFIVSHRISSVMKSDMIIVMRNGEIIEKGVHKSLLKSGGLYARLYEEQYKAAEPVQV